MANNDFNKPHFFLNSTAIPKNFTATSDRRIESNLTPARNRLLHSKKLRGDLATISADLNSLKHNNAL